MSAASRKASLKIPGWSDCEKKKAIRGEAILKLDTTVVVSKLTSAESAALASKAKEATLDLSAPQFQLETSSFLQEIPDVIKTLILNDNALTEFGTVKSIIHLTKLKRLELNSNIISNLLLKGLKSLETLSLAQNRLEAIPDLSDQEELIYLDLSGNRITTGFSELGKLKNLRVLDLGDCGIDLPENEFYTFVLPHLKKLTKLEYINFSGNPIQTTIREFRYFNIHELPKLKYLNWELIHKEDRSFASDLAQKGTWSNKNDSIAAHTPPQTNTLQQIRPQTGADGPHASSAPRHGTYASNRLEELLAPDAGKDSGKSNTAGSLEDLDKILDLVGSGNPLPHSPAPAPKSTQTSSVMDELDALLGPSGGLNTAGNRGSYVDTLSGILDDPTSKTPSPSASGTSLAASGQKPLDPLDELDAIIGSVNVKSPPAAASPVTNLSRSSSPSASRVATPPPPSRTVSVMDPLDLILNDLDDDSAPTPKAPSNRELNKPRSTIFEDLESEIFALESDHSAKTQGSAPPTPPNTASPPPTAVPALKKPHPVSTAMTAMSNNSDLDLLEQDIMAIKSSSQSVPPPASNTKPDTNPLDEILRETAAQPKRAPQPVALGSGLDALAQFTSSITTTQFDSLLDSFDSKSAKALSDAPASPQPGRAAEPASPAPVRSLQRGPRPSSAIAAKPALNPCEIPADALIYDFLLGKGVWGETFEGGWRNEGESKATAVTLKKLYNTDFDVTAVLKFREEVRDMLPLTHPNLIPLVGCSVRDSKVILWKSVYGAPLWGYLRNPNNMVTPKQVLGWARQLASAIAYLHSQNIIHGGIKTSNIIIDKEHNLTTKDYGFMDFKDEVPLTDSDPRWLAPEMIIGRESGYNEKIDVYAFGMVVYEMMMRESPFVTMKPAEIIDMLTYRVIRPECVPGIFPPVFTRLLAACWSHDPAERPPMEKVLRILESNPEHILGDYADMPLDTPTPKSAGGGPRGTAQFNKIPPRPSEPPKPFNLPSEESMTIGPKIVPKAGARLPAASVGTLEDASPGAKLSPTPARPSLRVAKPLAIKPLITEDLSLDHDQERKLVALLSKLSEMLASGEPDQQSRALNTLVEVVKDEKRINYVANKSLITRDLVELLRANSVDAVTSWRYEFPTAFETIELIMKTAATLSGTDDMARALVKHGMMVTLVEFASRGVDSLRILAGQAIGELCMTSEGREAFRKAAGVTAFHAMLKNKNEFVSAQAAWTLSSALNNTYNQEDFVNAGGLNTLIDLLQSTNAALKLRALDALSNFWGNDRAQEALTKASIKDKLIQMLSSTGPMLQKTAMRGIGKFSSHLSFQPTEIESLKILKAAMQVAQASDSLIRERLNAINICDNLTKDKVMMTNFRDMGGFSMMVKCVSDPHPDIRCAAIHVIQRALGEERSRDAIIALGAIAPLISQLASSNMQVRISAMGAVDVLRKYPRGQSAIIANAGVSRVVSIVAFSQDAHESALALALLDVFSDNPDYKEDVREAGGMTALLENLPTYNAECRLLASINIAHLCSTEKNRQALAEQKGIGALITSTQGLWRVAVHNAETAGNPFAPEAKLRTLVCGLLNVIYNLSQISDFRTALRDADAAQFVCDMYGTEVEEIQIHAVRALTSLAADPKNKVVIRTGAAKRLKEFALTNSNTLLAQSSNQVLVLVDAAT